jgi:hypothetical protein
MGYPTDFIGHIEVVPPLSVPEQDYLHVFGASRRHPRRSVPYAVPNRPHGDDGHPGSWCQWMPNCDGRCITHNGADRSHAPAEWLRYVIDHFLRPGAHGVSPSAEFRAFTFDHVCNGIVAACRRDTAKLFLIRVEDNVVTEETLVDGTPQCEVWSPFGYDSDLHRRRAKRVGPRQRLGAARLSSVVPLRLAIVDDSD